jgi:hypothetical protein
MFTTKRCLALLAFIVCGTFVFGQMPAGFPVMPQTGNPEADAVSYEQAKQLWMQQNPQFQPVNPLVGAIVNPKGDPQDVLNAQYEADKIAALAAAADTRATEQQANELRELQREYTLNKDIWAAADPERLQAAQIALGIQPVVGVSYIPQSEFLTFSPEKQLYLQSNPALFIIVQD